VVVAHVPPPVPAPPPVPQAPAATDTRPVLSVWRQRVPEPARAESVILPVVMLVEVRLVTVPVVMRPVSIVATLE
jgi:hypothetical protein